MSNGSNVAKEIYFSRFCSVDFRVFFSFRLQRDECDMRMTSNPGRLRFNFFINEASLECPNKILKKGNKQEVYSMRTENQII